MKITTFSILSVLLLVSFVVPATAESLSDHVVINEVDTNPPGDDSKNISEWVELYNPTDSKVDLSGWEIASTTVLKKTLVLPSGTFIEPGKFLKYSYQPIWFTDVSESVELRDNTGRVIDKTPFIADLKNDFSSWQRIYDGYDNNLDDDWKFSTSSAGSTNGKIPDVIERGDDLVINLFTDKEQYLFGQTALISGNISKEIVVTKPYFEPQKVILTITGPDYNKVIELYPDRDLNFKTSLSLHRVLGINDGTYELNARYGITNTQAIFSVGDETLVKEVPKENSLTLFTDKSQYIPGQTITLTGTTSKVVPFEGLNFNIKDPDGKIIATGNLYPTDGKFTTTVFLTTVSPVYGTYEIIGEYSDKSTYSTFELVKDYKEEKPISLWTDKLAYDLGETVQITGRLNDVWISSLDLEITQTKNIAIGSTGSSSGFKILDVARIQGDGTFSYSFKIPEKDSRLGEYKITVSKEIGSASKTIHAVNDSSNFVPVSEPLTLSTSKSAYELGDLLTINGFIENPSVRSSFETDVVKISISNLDGSPLQIIALPDGAQTRHRDGVTVAYEFTAVPTTSGSFSIQTPIAKNVFQEGTYLIKAQYLGLTKTITIDVYDPLKVSNASLTLNKEIFGLGEQLILNGIIPPSGESAISISLTKPDGSKINSGATIDNQKFTWMWKTPISEKPLTIKSVDDRSTSKTNYGIYKIHISTASYGKDIFFKVSPDPDNDSLSSSPLFVSTEKSLYKAGEKLKVIGNVIVREQGSEGLVVPDRVTIRILDGKFPYKQIHESQVYPNQGGQFQSLFELPPTIFSEGEYKVNALYKNKKVESIFTVTNDFLFGSDDPVSLLLSTDKTQYYPGDVVVLSGKPNKLVYLEKYDVSVIKKSETQITCGSFFCGKHAGPVTTIRPSSSGSFSYQFTIPDIPSSIGTYEMTVDADFETKSIKFDVAEKPIPTKIVSTKIEKQNRISDSQITIITEQKIIDDTEISPRVLSGSLLVAKEEQQNVDLQITSASGVCIIGQGNECLVKDSTRKQGQIYDIVNVDGVSLKIRYSGPDVRLEKFDILPELSDEFLPNSTWNVEIVKEDQASRFYYKINYKTIE